MSSRLLALAAAATAMLASTCGAQATPFRLTYNFSAYADVYPVDGYTADDHFTLKGNGSGIVDFDNSNPVASGSNSQLVFLSNNYFFLQAGDTPFEFEVEGGTVNQPVLGTQKFSFGLQDVVSDQYAPQGGGLFIEGGATGDGFTKGPDFSVTGSYTLSAVPLPASAPMFGAALLGIAGLGRMAKRKKAAAAA